MTQVVISNAEVRSRKWRWPALPASVVVALGWIAVMLVLACFSEIIAPYGFTKLDLRNRLAPPLTPGHWLGTDELGRDVLSRLVFSIRVSLLIAFGATIISATLGTTLGFLAAHFRSWVEQIVLMLADFQASMPFLILALSVLAFFGNSLRAADRSDGTVRLGALRAHLAWPCHFGERARLCGRDPPAGRQTAARLLHAHPAEHRLHPDRLDDAGVSRK